MVIRHLNEHRRAIFLFFPALYALISLVNHYCYRTYALDLGLYTNALWDYAHLRFNDSTTFRETAENLLADHFDLILPLLSPLVYLFGTYTLLIVQIVMIYAGGTGTERFLSVVTQNGRVAFAGRLYFYLHFGVYAALSFDYHSNVVAACLFPWFVYFVFTEKNCRAYVLLALMLFAKENTALWIFTGCSLLPFVLKKGNKTFWISAAVSLLYFMVVTLLIMPGLSVSGEFSQFKYAVLGENYGEAFRTVLTQPLTVIKTLFVNHTNAPAGELVKAEFWLFFLFSGGILLLLRPLWLLMLAPVFLQKLLHDQEQMWGVNGQYVIELVPFMSMGIFTWPILWQKDSGLSRGAGMIALVLPLLVSVRLMDSTVTHVPKENLRVYQPAHYETDLSRESLSKAVALVPDTAALSCQSFLVPHLALRDRVCQFPMVHNARYLLLIDNGRTYPVPAKDFSDTLRRYLADPHYKTLFAESDVYLFYKQKSAGRFTPEGD